MYSMTCRHRAIAGVIAPIDSAADAMNNGAVVQTLLDAIGHALEVIVDVDLCCVSH